MAYNWTICRTSRRRFLLTIGVSPRPMLMGAPSNAVKRSRRKYHSMQIVATGLPCPVCGAGVVRSLFCSLLSTSTPSWLKKDYGAPAARLSAPRPRECVSGLSYSVFKVHVRHQGEALTCPLINQYKKRQEPPPPSIEKF